MFGLFKKKTNYFHSKVLFSKEVLQACLLDQLIRNGNIVIVHFPYTQEELWALPGAQPFAENILLAERVAAGNESARIRASLKTPGRKVIFGERYPISAKEAAVAERLVNDCKIEPPFDAFCSFDDAIMQVFDGEKIKAMMVKLGMPVTEILEHSMISRSIERAQAKITEKNPHEIKTNSPEEWFRLNLNKPSL